MPIKFIGVLFLLLAMTVPGNAQTGNVSGRVSDPSGAAVAGAAVTMTAPNFQRTSTSGPAGEYRFAGVASGVYRIQIQRSGFVSATLDNITVGSGDVSVPATQLAIAGLVEGVVVSVSRRESTVLDSPATVSVIPESTLKSMPEDNLADVLRTVPGMNVVRMSARDINVTTRQATGTLATSQLTLLDGRSLYLDFMGFVVWDFVPTNTNEIKQIEVVRGPASAVWGANALSGVVNILTKSPRETPGVTDVSLTGGLFDRNAGSTAGRGMGSTWGTNVSTSQLVNDRWSYRLSAGYLRSDAYARPTGQIPIVADPRDPTGTATVGGAFYPADTNGPLGAAFRNRGTSQPKFDARVDQELDNGRISYAAGVAGTQGTIYTGIGPFDIQKGSVMSYGKVNYSRGALKAGFFTNIVDAEAPNLLVPNPRTGQPLNLNFKTQTYDVELGHSTFIGEGQLLSYGGNYRRNNFDITLAPNAKNRNEVGAYFQDEIFAGKWRFSLGGRVDKFGNIEGPVWSPRLAAIFQPIENHSLRVSFNRAFRSPSTINNYLDIELVNPVDLSGLSPMLPPALQPAVATPFNLLVKAVGSELPIGTTPQPRMKEESVTAWEFAYTGAVRPRTIVGAAFYINDIDDNTNFIQLPANLDPYTEQNPPPGWTDRGLPPFLLTNMAQAGIFLPRTAFTYANLGPIRQKGLELSLGHRISDSLSSFVNYSWQSKPQILDDPQPHPANELAFAPTHRFNLGGDYSGRRFLGAVSLNYTGEAFWSDVLTSSYHGFTDAYTLVNGAFGVKWRDGKITTSIKSTNIFNKTVQQHVFGDLLRRSITSEIRFRL